MRYHRAMDLTRACDVVAAFVRDTDCVTFLQIARILSCEGVPVVGEGELTAPFDHNLVFWAGMSPEFLEVMQALVGQRIFYGPCVASDYGREGLDLPLASWAAARAGTVYRVPHWQPVAFGSRPNPHRPVATPPASPSAPEPEPTPAPAPAARTRHQADPARAARRGPRALG